MKVPSSPLIVSLQITDKCNCMCTYCYNEGSKRTQEMSVSDFKRIVQDFHGRGVFNFVLEGGEPLLHPYFYEFTQLLDDIPTDYTVITNGTLINETTAHMLAGLNCDLIVSLDGITSSVHCRTRSRFKSVIKGIENLLKHNVFFGINTVLNKYNIDSCHRIIDNFYPQITRFNFLRLIPRSPDDSVIKNLILYSKGQVESLERKLRKICQNYPDIRIESPFKLSGRKSDTFHETMDVPGCLAGTTLITVKANLDVIPCSYCQNCVMGNLNDQPFDNIWNTELTNYLRRSSEPPCMKPNWSH